MACLWIHLFIRNINDWVMLSFLMDVWILFYYKTKLHGANLLAIVIVNYDLVFHTL